jgi:hypothetical protein
MYLLTYNHKDGYPIRLVFDSEKQAEYWGLEYSRTNNNSDYTIAKQHNVPISYFGGATDWGLTLTGTQ